MTRSPIRRHLQALALFLCSALLAGCGPNFASLAPTFARDVQVSPAQACAIGYDLARAIHQQVSLRRVVILAPRRATPCERHTLAYLRQSGFKVDETGQGGHRFEITLTRLEGDIVSATAAIGDDLRISRSYQPVHTGVLAQGPVSVQHLNPDTYTPRPTPSRGTS